MTTANREPIFFAWTRSFWATVVGLIIYLFSAPQEVLTSFGYMLAPFLPWEAEAIGKTLAGAAPAMLWLFAMQQRSHAARPYTVNPRKRK